MIQFVIGAAAGYVFGTKAGRKRFEQIKKGYQTAVNSPVTKSAVNATRKAIADRLDPQPRMREVKDVRKDQRKNMDEDTTILEPDEE